jgi:hypothetical protein
MMPKPSKLMNITENSVGSAAAETVSARGFELRAFMAQRFYAVLRQNEQGASRRIGAIADLSLVGAG